MPRLHKRRTRSRRTRSRRTRSRRTRSRRTRSRRTRSRRTRSNGKKIKGEMEVPPPPIEPPAPGTQRPRTAKQKKLATELQATIQAYTEPSEEVRILYEELQAAIQAYEEYSEEARLLSEKLLRDPRRFGKPAPSESAGQELSKKEPESAGDRGDVRQLLKARSEDQQGTEKALADLKKKRYKPNQYRTIHWTEGGRGGRKSEEEKLITRLTNLKERLERDSRETSQ